MKHTLIITTDNRGGLEVDMGKGLSRVYHFRNVALYITYIRMYRNTYIYTNKCSQAPLANDVPSFGPKNKKETRFAIMVYGYACMIYWDVTQRHMVEYA